MRIFHAHTQKPSARVTKERMFSKENMREIVLGIQERGDRTVYIRTEKLFSLFLRKVWYRLHF